MGGRRILWRRGGRRRRNNGRQVRTRPLLSPSHLPWTILTFFRTIRSRVLPSPSFFLRPLHYTSSRAHRRRFRIVRPSPARTRIRTRALRINLNLSLPAVIRFRRSFRRLWQASSFLPLRLLPPPAEAESAPSRSKRSRVLRPRLRTRVKGASPRGAAQTRSAAGLESERG